MAEKNVFAELQRRKDEYDNLPREMRDFLFTLTPEELDEFDASMKMMDQENIVEIQRQLPEELRFGGDYGLLSALGYYGDDPEDPADIKNYYTPEGGLASIVGEYMRPDNPNLYIADKSPIARFLDEVDLPRKGKDVAVFAGSLGSASSPLERRYMSKEGYSTDEDTDSYARTVAHELQHAGLDSPVVRRFLEEQGKNPLMSAYDQHRFIDAANRPDAPLSKSDIPRYENFIEDLTEFITPEIAEEYGIRLPIRSLPPEEPSTIDKIIDFIRGR